MVEVDVRGTRDFLFVDVSRFEADGRCVSEEMWGSNECQTLEQFLSAEAGFSDEEAKRQAADLLAAYSEQGGYTESATLTRKFTLGVVGGLAAVALLAALLTVAISAVLRRAPVRT
jgi:hypothetical protein